MQHREFTISNEYHYDTADAERGAGNGESLVNGLPTSHPLLVLEDFSLDIRAGETLAVVGYTGAGKSSLMKLILRFYDFQGGRLLIEGTHAHLLALGGHYAELYRTYFRHQEQDYQPGEHSPQLAEGG